MYGAEKVAENLVKKIKKSLYEKVQTFLLIYYRRRVKDKKLNDQYNKKSKKNCVLFVSTKKHRSSVFYTLVSPFELLHGDNPDIRFVAKSAGDPKYFLMLVDIFTSNI